MRPTTKLSHRGTESSNNQRLVEQVSVPTTVGSGALLGIANHNMEQPKTEGTYFKEDIEALLKRYSTLSVYETIGALEVVKQNLLERLGRINEKSDNDGRDA